MGARAATKGRSVFHSGGKKRDERFAVVGEKKPYRRRGKKTLIPIAGGKRLPTPLYLEKTHLLGTKDNNRKKKKKKAQFGLHAEKEGGFHSRGARKGDVVYSHENLDRTA